MTYPVTAFLGAGNMGSAIIAGLIKNGYPAEKIIAANPGTEKLTTLSADFGIRTTPNNCQAVNDAEVIILAVKPSVIESVCTEISACINQQLVLSIAAGKTISSIKKYLQNDNPVIRAMPNTPCLLSEGAIGIYAEDKVSQANRNFVDSLFATIGKTVWLDTEQQIDVVTALSGSGPAYYFYLTEALIEAGIQLGLDEQLSKTLVNQTALGAIAMVNQKPLKTALKLRQSVTSPNGTTEAAIKLFDQQNLNQTIIDAVKAATNRGKEISCE